METLKGTIAISRTIGNYKIDKPMCIEIVDDNGKWLCAVYLTYEGYAKATTGTYVDCDITLNK